MSETLFRSWILDSTSGFYVVEASGNRIKVRHSSDFGGRGLSQIVVYMKE